jgi:hypothetical protein
VKENPERKYGGRFVAEQFKISANKKPTNWRKVNKKLLFAHKTLSK